MSNELRPGDRRQPGARPDRERWTDGADHHIDICSPRRRAQRLDKRTHVSGIARQEQVAVNPLDRERPAQLAGEIGVLRAGQDRPQRLTIAQAGRLGLRRRLRELLLHRKAGEVRLDPAERVDIAATIDTTGRHTGSACWTIRASAVAADANRLSLQRGCRID